MRLLRKLSNSALLKACVCACVYFYFRMGCNHFALDRCIRIWLDGVWDIYLCSLRGWTGEGRKEKMDLIWRLDIAWASGCAPKVGWRVLCVLVIKGSLKD